MRFLVIGVVLMVGGMLQESRAQEFDTSYVMEEIRVPLWQAGFTVGGTFHAFTADMRGLPGVPSCCPTYDKGNGSGLFAGLLFDYPLASRLRIGSRLGVGLTTGEFRTEEHQFVDNGNSGLEGTIEHTINATLPTIMIEPGISYEMLNGLHGGIGVGVDLYVGSSFEQHERLISPDNIRFENDRRERMNFEGSISELNPLGFSLTGSFRYDLPMNQEESLLLSPEIIGRLGLTEVVPGTSWQASGLRFGLGIRYERARTDLILVDYDSYASERLDHCRVQRTGCERTNLSRWSRTRVRYVAS